MPIPLAALLLPALTKIVPALLKGRKINWTDKRALRIFLKELYKAIPDTIKLVVSEEKFIDFCIEHKGKIAALTGSTISKTPAKKTTKKKTVSPKPATKKSTAKKPAAKSPAKKKPVSKAKPKVAPNKKTVAKKK